MDQIIALSDAEEPDFATRFAVTSADLCAGIHARHGAAIAVKKTRVAVANLERMLTAALAIGNRKGFHSMTMRDLAEASGLSMGALYTYVDTKETPLRMILGAVADAVVRVVAPWGPGEADCPLLRLRGLILRHVLLTEAMQPWFAFAFMEVKAFDPTARAQTIAEELRTEALIVEAIQSGMDAGFFRTVDATAMAGLVKPMLQDWYLKRWKHRRRGTTPEAYAQTVSDFVEQALRRA